LSVEILNLILSIIETIIVSATFVVLAQQVGKEYTWRKKEKAITFSTYNANHMRGVMRKIEQYFPDYSTRITPIPLAAIRDAVAQSKDDDKDKDHDLINDVNYLLSKFEELGLSVEQGVADFNTAYELVYGNCRRAIMIFSEYIDDERKQEKRPLLWEYAVRLAYRFKENYDRQVANHDLENKHLQVENEFKVASKSFDSKT